MPVGARGARIWTQAIGRTAPASYTRARKGRRLENGERLHLLENVAEIIFDRFLAQPHVKTDLLVRLALYDDVMTHSLWREGSIGIGGGLAKKLSYSLKQGMRAYICN